MALGGGLWTAQNKALPGAYINFSSVAAASANLSERGIAALPLALDWGPEGEIITLTSAELQTSSLRLLGHAYTDDALLPLRELFAHAHTLYTYRLSSGGVKAANTFCTAKYAGTAGNRLSTVVAVNADDEDAFDVSTYIDTDCVDTQTVTGADELVDNDFVSFKADATLAATAKTPLAGGTDGTVSNSAYQSFLDKLESYRFHALGCPSADAATIGLFVNYTERLRDEVGAKFQTVVYSPADGTKHADYEGVIELGNSVSDTGVGAFGLVYWMTGAAAGCAVNASNTNRVYDGELTVNVDYTQTALAQALQNGRLMLHNVDGVVRVLEDINSLVTLSDTKGEVFQANQTVRVCDQIANDVAVLFGTRYFGSVPNDAAGRAALWNDICNLLQELETLRAVEDFDTASVSVEQGESKKAVLCSISGLNVVNAMAQLYMSVVIQ